ncbi:MAG TPA: DUF6483 family protein [Clostridia bacterium]|nr:DUF6483 family protein [Clostridia bacterium]
MFYQSDWIMRQIQMMVDLVARLVFQKSAIAYEIENTANPSPTDLLFAELNRLIAEQRFNAAEDHLLDHIDPHNRKHLELALDFYQKLNQFSDEELEQNDFPRQEITDGIKAVLELFQLSNLIA